MEIVMNKPQNMEAKNLVSVMPTTLNVQKEAKPLSWTCIGGCYNFDRPVTISEAINQVGANFEVKKEKLIRIPDNVAQAVENGETSIDLSLTPDMLIDSHMATVRTDTNRTLGVVGSKYGVVQNYKAFEFIDMLTSGSLGKEAPVIQTAGIINNGQRVYVTAKMPSNIFLNDKDKVEDYIMFTNTHDGSGAVTVLFTPIRVVCKNTLNMALNLAKNKLIFKHTLNVNNRLEWTKEENMRHALQILEQHKKFKESFKAELLTLAVDKVTDKEVMAFAAAVALGENKKAEMKLLKEADYNIEAVDEISRTIKNRVNALRDTIENGVGQEFYRGSKLWLINGLTTFFSNEKKYKTAEDKFSSLMEGTDLKKLNYGYQLLAA